jgi:hypothetical protein
MNLRDPAFVSNYTKPLATVVIRGPAISSSHMCTYVVLISPPPSTASYNEFSKGERKTQSSAERRQSFVGQNNRFCGHKIN